MVGSHLLQMNYNDYLYYHISAMSKPSFVITGWLCITFGMKAGILIYLLSLRNWSPALHVYKR
jgi:hypothetical protein